MATIPTGDAPEPAGLLAVDDEPEEAASASARAMTPQREGDVIDDAADLVPPDDEDDVPPPVDPDAPLPPRGPVAVERPEPPEPSAPSARSALSAPRRGGIERVGESVVRQVLGATFVREEPYTPPSRFS